MKKLFPVLIIGLVFFSACGDDFFSTTLKVDPPSHEDRLVLQSYIKSNDSLLYFSLSKSLGILETIDDGDDYIDDAKIEVYEDGVLKYEPSFSNETLFNYEVILNEPIGGVGKTYEVRVKHDTLGKISAMQKMPSKPTLVSAVFDEEGGFGNGLDYQIHAIDLVIADEPEVDNYYEVILVTKDTYNENEPFNAIYSYSIDINSSIGFHEYMLLNDASFDGEEYTFRFDTEYNWEDELFVSVRAVTRDWYLYSKSLYSFHEGKDFALFAEPVTVHSNIENGLGVFALGNETLIKVAPE